MGHVSRRRRFRQAHREEEEKQRKRRRHNAATIVEEDETGRQRNARPCKRPEQELVSIFSGQERPGPPSAKEPKYQARRKPAGGRRHAISAQGNTLELGEKFRGASQQAGKEDRR